MTPLGWLGRKTSTQTNQHRNLTKGNRILWKRGEIAPKEQFLLFFTIFSIYSISKLRSQIIWLKYGCSIYFFLSSANLICQGTDIAKYFREPLGLRDNESRLYFTYFSQKTGFGITSNWSSKETMDVMPKLVFWARVCNPISVLRYRKVAKILPQGQGTLGSARLGLNA